MKNDWITLATPVAIVFAKKNYEFTGEVLSDYLNQQVGPPPKDAMYGYVLRTVLADNGLIIPVGFTKAKKKSAKGRRVVKWRSTVTHGASSLLTIKDQLKVIRARFVTHQIGLDDALMEAYRAGLGSVEFEE